MYLQFIAAGILGGIVRGLTGYVKYLPSYKGVKFDWRYFTLMVGASGVIGGIAGWVMNSVMEAEAMNAVYAFLAGYAGGDFIENAFKIIFKKPTLFKIPEVLKASLK
jgi:uncharacterized membrane protein YfcA